jgi:hypothetical protein
MDKHTVERLFFICVIAWLLYQNITKVPDCPPVPDDIIRIDTFYVELPAKTDTGKAVRDTARYKKKNKPLNPPGTVQLASSPCDDTAEYDYFIKDENLDMEVTARVVGGEVDTFYSKYSIKQMLVEKEVIKFVPHYTPTRPLSLYPFVEAHLGVKNSYAAGAFFLKNRNAFGGGYNFTDKQVILKYGYGIF